MASEKRQPCCLCAERPRQRSFENTLFEPAPVGLKSARGVKRPKPDDDCKTSEPPCKKLASEVQRDKHCAELMKKIATEGPAWMEGPQYRALVEMCSALGKQANLERQDMEDEKAGIENPRQGYTRDWKCWQSVFPNGCEVRCGSLTAPQHRHPEGVPRLCRYGRDGMPERRAFVQTPYHLDWEMEEEFHEPERYWREFGNLRPEKRTANTFRQMWADRPRGVQLWDEAAEGKTLLTLAVEDGNVPLVEALLEMAGTAENRHKLITLRTDRAGRLSALFQVLLNGLCSAPETAASQTILDLFLPHVVAEDLPCEKEQALVGKELHRTWNKELLSYAMNHF